MAENMIGLEDLRPAKGNVNLNDIRDDDDDDDNDDIDDEDIDDRDDLEGKRKEKVDDQLPPRGIPTKEFNDLREQKREVDRLLVEANARIAELEKLSPDTGIPEEDLKAAVAELAVIPEDADEKQKQAILRQTESQLRGLGKLFRPNRRATESERRELTELRELVLDIRDQQTFDSEWESVADMLADTFPRASQKQFREARKAMDDLAHAPQFADKDFEYVYFKNKDIFDDILGATRRKTFETRESRPGGAEEEEPEPFDAKKLPPEKLLKLKEKLDAEARREDEASGWNIKNPTTF